MIDKMIDKMMTTEQQSEQLIKDKMSYYANKDILLHISKKNREWLNCKVLKEKDNGVYVVYENKHGIQHIFLNEIFKIEEKKQEENVLNDFLENSPYTEKEKEELTLSIYGLKNKLNKIERLNTKEIEVKI